MDALRINSIVAVACGGAIGSVTRYLLSVMVTVHTGSWRFPLATFLVNIIGCFVIGILAGLAVEEHYFSGTTRLFLFTGIMGGFTTFSTFGLETFALLRRLEFFVAGSYVLLSVAVGLMAVWLGFMLSSMYSR